MIQAKISRGLVLILIFVSFSRCTPEKVILHGDISGTVTDTVSGLPLQSVKIRLSTQNDTASTGSDGNYVLKNILPNVPPLPANYTIEASKPPYAKSTKSLTVEAAKTSEVDFHLHIIPYPEIFPRKLEIGLDTIKSFTIKNTGTESLKYSFNVVDNWIIVEPAFGGDATTETDTVVVKVNRTGLSKAKRIGRIEIISYLGKDILQDTVYVYLNGVIDTRDNKFYGIVKIGTQVWMAENLNYGDVKMINQIPADSVHNDGKDEKYCYNNLLTNCDIYGGLYHWAEMMNYNPSDSGLIGITKGVCMEGWHVPTPDEFETLFFFLGGTKFRNEGTGYTLYQGGVGGKLKAVSNLWNQPNQGATDENGFSALPAGYLALHSETDWGPPPHWSFDLMGWSEKWLTSAKGWTLDLESQYDYVIGYHYSPPIGEGEILLPDNYTPFALSVRCVKNPEKK